VTINILGTDYDLAGATYDNDKLLADRDGYVDKLNKHIRYETKIEDAIANPEIYTKAVIRHELVHAFFYESRLDGYCRDEALVDWIALQLPKILKVCQQAEVI